MNKKRKRKNTLLWCLGGIVILLLLLVVLFWGITKHGILKLRGDSAKQAPVISEAEAEDDWEEGWVRYKGEPHMYNEDILTFLVMGIDEMKEVSKAKNGISGGQADALFLVVMNPHDKSVNVVAINRNMMAQVDVYDEDNTYVGQHLKQIALQHGYGDGMQISCERTVDAVSRHLFNLPINGYVAINMGAIRELNTAVDGVTLTVLQDIDHDWDGLKVKLNAGEEVTLNGDQAYVYVSRRNLFRFNSASERVERQKQYIGAFASKVKQKLQGDITFALDLYHTIERYMVTDIEITEFAYLVTEVLGYSFDEGSFHTLQGEVIMGEEFEEFYVDDDALYELIMELFYEPVEQ